MRNFIKNKKLILFGPKCPNLGIWYLNFPKSNVTFEISAFEIGKNFVKIRKLILFGPKYPNLGIWAQNFQKQMTDLMSAPSKDVKFC